MSREFPFFIKGTVVEILPQEITIVKVPNGNLYHLKPSTPGIEYSRLQKGDIVECEVTSMLTRVLSAKVIEQTRGGKGSNPLGS